MSARPHEQSKRAAAAESKEKDAGNGDPLGEVRGSVLLPVRLVIQSVGSGAVELGELQKHVEEKRAREKKKNNRDSKQLIRNSAKKRKKQSKLKTDQEKRQIRRMKQHFKLQIC